MLELSLHILDIAENSIRAGAKCINIVIDENVDQDELLITVEDDGAGMSEKSVIKALDPFYTTKKVRRVGLGLPMLAQAAEQTGGKLTLDSEEGMGTKVTVTFAFGNIDRQPLGNIAGTMITLIAGNPQIDFLYRHQREGREYVLDTREIKREIDDIPIDYVDILKLIRASIEDGLEDIGAQA
jgi:anti-sigma regulatory factor (Ser/Thr protein kinase)